MTTAPDERSVAAAASLREQDEIVIVITRSGWYRLGPPDRPVAVASVTKPLVALAVLVAVEEGTIGLDDPAGPPGSTVRHLLSHTAGYAFDDRSVVARPGERRIYSNASFDVLADHLTERSGIPWPRYVSEAVLEPLEMTTSAIVGPAGSGLRSTAGDLAHLGAEFLAPTLISDATAVSMRTIQFPDTAGVVPGYGQFRPCPWGLGVEIKGAKSPHWTADDGSSRTYGHFGANGSFIWVDPDADVSAVVVNDRAFGTWASGRWGRLSSALLDLGRSFA